MKKNIIIAVIAVLVIVVVTLSFSFMNSSDVKSRAVLSHKKEGMPTFVVNPFEVSSSIIAKSGAYPFSKFSKVVFAGMQRDFIKSKEARVLSRNFADSQKYAQEMSLIAPSLTKKVYEEEHNAIPKDEEFKLISLMHSMSKYSDVERNNPLAGNSAKSENGKQESLLVADYIVIGEVNDINIDQKESTYYNQTSTSYTGNFDVSYKVLDINTLELVDADSIEFKLPKIPDNNTNVDITKVFKNASSKISGQILQTLKNAQNS